MAEQQGEDLDSQHYQAITLFIDSINIYWVTNIDKACSNAKDRSMNKQ